MRIVFMGRRPHAVDCLEWLVEQGHEIVRVVCPSGTGAETPYWSPTVKDTAERLGLPITTSSAIHKEVVDPRFETDFADVDLVVSFLYWKRIREPLVSLARFGCINFHPAPLPGYKGLGGYNFAIMEELDEWGATAHYVDTSFDTGPIIRVDSVPFDHNTDTAFSLEHKTREVMIDLFKGVIDAVALDGLLPTLPNEGGRYYTREDMETSKIIDPATMTEDEIDRRARAFWYPPFQGAHFVTGDQRFTVVPQSVLDSLTILHNV